MADTSLVYTLNLPNVSDVVFNANGLRYGDGQDGFFLNRILGLDGAPLRTPNDNAPGTHGGIIHRRKKGPRITTWEGRFYTQTVWSGNAIAAMRTAMENVLKDALEDLYDDSNPGTMTWTPRGGSPVSLTVLAQVPVEFDIELGVEPQIAQVFSFGLISADPDPA